MRKKKKNNVCLRKYASCFFLFIICGSVCPDKVNDPMMAAQIAWMMEVPEIYRLCYDKPFKLQPDASG